MTEWNCYSKVTNDYKAAMAVENVDWETYQNKYGDILDRFREHYPPPEEAMATRKDYLHKTEEITKGHITTKLKAIRIRYWQVVDSGRKSGHGRVVLLFFELCESIWGGSPATLTLSVGIETSDVGPEVPVLEQTGAELSISSGERVEEVSVSADMENRRQRLDATLTNHRRQKLKRKLSPDAIAQEYLEIKRRLATALNI